MRRQRFQHRSLIPTLMLVATVIVSGAAQAKGIRDLLSSALELHGVPAMAAAVITSDRILEMDAVGVQRLGWPSSVLATDRFHLGSLTKAMTSTLLAVLVEEGRLHWETRVMDVFSELAASAHRDFRHVTVEDLVSSLGIAPVHGRRRVLFPSAVAGLSVRTTSRVHAVLAVSAGDGIAWRVSVFERRLRRCRCARRAGDG